jgi:amino acid transporter
MEKPERKFPITIVNILVAVAILMILAALVVPSFVPPQSKKASAVTPPSTPTAPAKR